MKDGERFEILVTDAQKAYKDVASLENGTYLIYNSFNSGDNLSFLKNDGTSTVLTASAGQALTEGQLNDYKWTVTKNRDGTYSIKSLNGNRYINLYGSSNQYDQWSSNGWNSVQLSGTNGIAISQNGKVLKRDGNKQKNNQSNPDFGRFYNSTGTGVGLTFYKIELNSGGSSGTPGIVLTDDERAELEKW